MTATRKDATIQHSSDAGSSNGSETGHQTLPVVVRPHSGAGEVGAHGRRSVWIWVAGAVLASGLTGLLYLQPWATRIPVVAVETMVPGAVSRVLAVNGRIAGTQSVDVRPLVSGSVVDIMVAEGDTVTHAPTLMQMDSAAQQAVLRQAKAGLDAALVAHEDAEATLARTRALAGNATRVALETAVRAEQSAAQEVARMTALVDQAQIQLKNYTIRAPIAGSVLILTAEFGQTVDPSTVMMTIADLGKLVVETDVDESYATQISVGQPAALQLSGETAVLDAHVSFVSQKVDEATGGLGVKLTPDVALTAPIGLTVTANITVDDRAAALTVPRTAIVRDATGDGVLVVEEGKANRRLVQVIAWPAARLIVTDGLAPGDVVISDATGISDGQAVKVAP